jgi:ribosomal protein S18 acetylase RimI-like enzyme
MTTPPDEQPSNAPQEVALRPVLPEDAQFLYEVYRSTRAEELAQVPWEEAQLEAFLKMQLRARDQSYRMYYEGIDDRIILSGGEPVGRLIVVRAEEGMRLADVALLPGHRGKGIGSTLVKDLTSEAAASGKPLVLQVETWNEGARRLYERLGFTATGATATHFQMEYRPGAPL